MAESTFLYRAIAGVTCFVLLGAWDYWRHPENPTRMREYMFLFGVTALVMGYGVIHDFGTWLISHDYYVTAKGIPSAVDSFGWPVTRLALLATWNVGLIGAVILLLANNPDRHGRRVGYRWLLKVCLIPLVVSMVCECIAGLVFYVGSERMRDFLPIDLLIVGVDDPFVVVWGMHLGAYGGAGLGVLVAVVMIVRAKRRLPEQMDVRSKGWRAWLGLPG